MNTRKIAALLGAGALAVALAAPVSADVVWATVDGHMASTSENNDESFWGEDCFKLNAGEGDLGVETDTYLLTDDYSLVVVKAGSSSGDDPNSLTIFEDPAEGETVWADSNGSNAFDEGDKNISHLILCPAEEEETEPPVTEPPVTEAPSFEQSQAADTDAPTEPNTATVGGNGTSAPADGAWLLVVALGVLLSSIVVLTPARARTRR